MKRSGIRVIALFLTMACAGVSEAASGVRMFAVDTGKRGAVLPNPSQMLTVWSVPKKVNLRVLSRLEWDVRDFAKWVEIMAATGGNVSRDCFREPKNRAVKDDYDFTGLVNGCKMILAQGMKPYVKLGNVPVKLSSNIADGDFGMNVRPPDDYAEYGRYMEACANALRVAFGKEELLKWRFAVLTEYENPGWFLDASGDSERTFQAYCLLYETTVKAFVRVISPDLAFGAHAMAVTEGKWDERRFFAFVAVRRLPLKFVTASFYDVNPGRYTRGLTLPKTIRHLRAAAEKTGHRNLFYGVDEGRILYGKDGGKNSRNLALRIVGDTYQAAYDARILHQLFDSGAEYFAAWGYFTGPHSWYEGVPSVSFHVAKEAAKFKGMHRVPVVATGGEGAGPEIEAVAAMDRHARRLQIMAYSFTNSLHATGTVGMRFAVKFLEAWRGKRVAVTRRLVDDNVNWFPQWRKDRAALGLTNDRFRWSPDDPAVMSDLGLIGSKERAHFQNVLLPRYRKLARLKATTQMMTVEDTGDLVLDFKIQVNSAMFLEFECTRDLTRPDSR